jgi:ABC-type transport system involved in multi-copper enzyme maturation permease subunit
MTNPFQTPFAAVFCNEVRLNIKRVAPYALMIFFSSNAILWWGWGPAVAKGWATNSDFYIARNHGGFAIILGLPIFTAIMMGDVVIRDFRLGVDPLIFSKPVGRGSYLLGKFFGNFFVLVCCQAAFTITFCLLQWVPFSGMVTLPVRILPYFKHFFIIVVISHLVLAAFYFAVGTISRNAKIVFGLAACFYPTFIAAAFVLKNLPSTLQILVEPMGFNLHSMTDPWRRSAAFLNQYVVTYTPYAIANRVWMIIVSAVFLFIVYRRFAIDPQATTRSEDHFTMLTLSNDSDTVVYGLESGAPSYELVDRAVEALPTGDRITLPKVTSTRGPATTLFKIFAAVGVEFRLVRAERSLLILFPLVVFLYIFDLAFFRVYPESYSVTYASCTAKALLLFLVGLIIFYTGEAMHRDREVRVQPIVWSMPAPNSALLLSKCLGTALLAFSLLAVVGLIAIVVQVFRGHTPVDFSAYFKIYGIVIVPSIIFMTALVVAFNAVLRNKYLAYVVAVGTSAGLLYLYNTGRNHWSYNPLLYHLWNYQDLTTTTILTYRLYCLGLAAAFLALAHIFFQRK